MKYIINHLKVGGPKIETCLHIRFSYRCRNYNSICYYIDIAFDAAIEGLDLWFNIVFNLASIFIVHINGAGCSPLYGYTIGTLYETLFNVPGTGSFVLAMGLASGYPIGAMLQEETGRKLVKQS